MFINILSSSAIVFCVCKLTAVLLVSVFLVTTDRRKISELV